MSVRTDAEICYGILLEEGIELPWDEEYEGDVWAWWDRVKDNPEHKIPFELINCCSLGFPIYILAIPGTVIEARRGYPTIIDPPYHFSPFNSDNDANKQDTVDLIEFCKKYKIPIDYENIKFRWWLSSFWEC